MWKLIPISLLQCGLLSVGQVLLKFALQRIPPFGWTREFWLSLICQWQFLACGACFFASSMLWIYILKIFPLGIAYQMLSLCYVITMVLSVLVFHESVPLHRWIGCLLIMGGCILILKP